MAEMDLSTLRSLGFRTTVPQLSGNGETTDQPSSSGSPITDSIYGINYMQTPLPVPMNKDHYGYTFFTRPQLNFQRANLLKSRRFIELLGVEELNWYRIIRCLLDPRLQLYSEKVDYEGNNMGVQCRVVDAYNPFIPLLSNHLVSLSGFPDKMSPVYRSPEGQYRESQSMVDGANVYYGAYNISATFRNSKGDPITKLFDFWEDYQSLVFEGILVPYLDMMLGGLFDYHTRIYRVTLDASKRYVAGYACSGISFPISNAKAQQYDYNMDKPYNDANNQMTIQFESNGCWWDDPIVLWSFNTVVGAFNPSMRTAATRNADMKRVPHELFEFFNCRAYPRIDPATRRMEWYVPKTYFTAVEAQAKAAVEQMLDITTGTQQREVMTDLTATNGILAT